jgi:superfamily II DNA or RNA helicase
MPSPPTLSFEQGLAVVRGEPLPTLPTVVQWDARFAAYVAAGHHYPALREWALAHAIPERSNPAPWWDASFADARTPRDAQRDAMQRWQAAGSCGTVVLPTGAGKTFVALLAIASRACATCVVVPTRALVNQWFTQLADAFGAERVGAWYGDEKQIRDITVTTYHSAFALFEREGARFNLVVCDEVHRLADSAGGDASGWHDALTIAPCAYRLGLTATYPDGRDATLTRLIGPVVYRRYIGEMTDAELARFALERRYVGLTRAERARYDACSARFEAYGEASGWRSASSVPTDAWKRFVASTRRDPRARRAFRDFLERERIVRMAEAKFDEALRLLRLFPEEQAVVFCGGVDMAMEVSRRLAIPLITATTPASERHAILAGMREGTVRAVVTVQVLDEGWDVPNAKLGIVLGDSSRGGVRQHTQRLGRLLRRQGDQMAALYEVVAADTWEFYSAQKRTAGVKRVAEPQLGFGL